MNKWDCKIKFKATKRFYNLYNIRMTHVVNVDIEYNDKSDSIEDIQNAVEEYAKFKKLTDPNLISYTRYA